MWSIFEGKNRCPYIRYAVYLLTESPADIMQEERPALDTFWIGRQLREEKGERGNRKIMAKSKLINGDDDDYDARHAMHEIGAAVAAAPRRAAAPVAKQ